jgi:hypothetical protein
MGDTCNGGGGMMCANRILVQKLNGIDYMGNLGIDRKIILKYILKNCGEKRWSVLAASRYIQ